MTETNNTRRVANTVSLTKGLPEGKATPALPGTVQAPASMVIPDPVVKVVTAANATVEDIMRMTDVAMLKAIGNESGDIHVLRACVQRTNQLAEEAAAERAKRSASTGASGIDTRIQRFKEQGVPHFLKTIKVNGVDQQLLCYAGQARDKDAIDPSTGKVYDEAKAPFLLKDGKAVKTGTLCFQLGSRPTVLYMSQLLNLLALGADEDFVAFIKEHGPAIEEAGNQTEKGQKRLAKQQARKS